MVREFARRGTIGNFFDLKVKCTLEFATMQKSFRSSVATRDPVTSISTIEGHADFRGWKTWYCITGDLQSGKVPLLVLHGGPGCTHDYVDSLKEIAATGRAVIHYDQLGNGKSTHLPEKGADFWTVDLFLAELDNLLTHLGIAGAYDIYGQSWGGMLGSEHAVRRPTGLRALVLANSPSSMALWVSEANRLRRALPGGVHEILLRHEEAGTTDAPEYLAATKVFYDNHVCRVVPWPPEVARTFAAMDIDSTVYRSMNGPTEFHVIGTLKTWSIIERLDRIVAPTLVISGRYDEATSAVIQPFADRIPGAHWHVFEQSSHMPHVEEKAACLALVAAFLDRHDRD
jgi:L-proline amide hydrolase